MKLWIKLITGMIVKIAHFSSIVSPSIHVFYSNISYKRERQATDTDRKQSVRKKGVPVVGESGKPEKKQE